MKPLKILAGLCLLGTLSSPASAAVVHDEGKTEVSVGALTRYQFEVENADDETRIGSNLMTGRLQVSAIHHDVGNVAVQYDAASQIFLDAFVDISRNSPIGIRVGRFRTPIGAEWQIGLKDLPTSVRTLIAERVLGRATGLDVYADFKLGEVEFRADVGLFNPTLSTRVEDGQVLGQRLRLGFRGAYFHAAYATHVMGDNDLSNGGRNLPFEDQVDLALGYEKAGFRLLAEAFISFDPIIADETVWNVYGLASYVVGDPKTGVAWEPTIAFDHEFSGENREDRNRLQLLVNVLWSERDLMTSIGVSRTAQVVNGEDQSDLKGFFFVQGAI